MSERNKVTVSQLQQMKMDGQKIAMITAYDYPTGVWAERAAIDILLVGDSMAMTVLGYSTTLPATMDELVNHSQAVNRGNQTSFVLGDMPYMSYQPSVQLAVQNAGRFMSEGGCDGIKLEGGVAMADRVEAIVNSGIPVMGHLGLTPQSMSMLSGFKAQGKDALIAKKIIDDAKALEEAGAFSILLEAVPSKVSKLVTERAQIPIIGIGAGPDCDGQVLIFHDMFGLYPAFTPKFAKQYADLGKMIVEGLEQYGDDVRSGAFPEAKHSFTISDQQYEELLTLLG
ncbi:MAG TPA: 3-methyl-2-oxobutanoate hydroxymethyltransferase [Chloroflexi bacterium]|nr:3-methyl-2-oxobutanoate hydroxymethyltransferase [Chloroflexota bacterium]